MRIKIDIPEYDGKYGVDKNSDLNEFIHTLALTFLKKGCILVKPDEVKDYDIRIISNLDTLENFKKGPENAVTIGIIDRLNRPTCLIGDNASWEICNENNFKIIHNSDICIFYSSFLKGIYEIFRPPQLSTPDLSDQLNSDTPKIIPLIGKKSYVIGPGTNPEIIENYSSTTMSHPGLSNQENNDYDFWIAIADSSETAIISITVFLNLAPPKSRIAIFGTSNVDFSKITQALRAAELNGTMSSKDVDKIAHIPTPSISQLSCGLTNAGAVIHISDGFNTPNILNFCNLTGTKVITNAAGSNNFFAPSGSLIFNNLDDTKSKNEPFYRDFDYFSPSEKKCLTKSNTDESSMANIDDIADAYIKIFKDELVKKREV
jgi:hypothetical protein